MKKTITLFIVSVFTLSLSSQTKVLHLNMGSHNETSDPLNYMFLPDHNTIRALIKQMADSIIAKNVKWNMQVDANFIRGTLKNDTAYTNPNDILEWADDQANIEVDPHNHFNSTSNPYNFADLAHLLDSCGLTGARKNVGGFLWDSTDWTSSNDHWNKYATGLQGNTFPTYTWTPTTLWGAGSTPPHSNDVDDLGIWMPTGATSKTQFKTHNPNGNITVIGHGCNWVIYDTTNNPQWIVDNIISYLNYFNAQPVTNNTFYVGTIMMNFRDFNSANYINKVMTVINGLAPYGPSGTGQIKWETLTEKYTAWYNAHSSTTDYFELECSNVTLALGETITAEGQMVLYPNPTSDNLSVNLDHQSVVLLFDITGRQIKEFQMQAGINNLVLSDLQEGVYVLKAGAACKKVIIQR